MSSQVRVNTIGGAVGINTLTVTSSLSLEKSFIEMSQTITEDYKIQQSKNALTVGPVEIASGITVEVPSGSNWVVL
jgi:hypothetical protein